MKTNEKPNCRKCEHRKSIPGDAHISCTNSSAKVTGHRIGVNGGWFMWPWNFDPNWLLECDRFKLEEQDHEN